MMYQVERTIRFLIVWWQGMRGGEVLHSPMIRSQSFSEIMPLDCELYMFLSSLPLPLSPLDGAGWLE